MLYLVDSSRWLTCEMRYSNHSRVWTIGKISFCAWFVHPEGAIVLAFVDPHMHISVCVCLCVCLKSKGCIFLYTTLWHKFILKFSVALNHFSSYFTLIFVLLGLSKARVKCMSYLNVCVPFVADAGLQCARR